MTIMVEEKLLTSQLQPIIKNFYDRYVSVRRQMVLLCFYPGDFTV